MKNDDLKDPKDLKNDAPEGDGCGAAKRPRMQKRWKRKQAFMKEAKNHAGEAAAAILGASPHPDLLSRKDRCRIAAAFRRVLFPPKKSGRPRSPQITSAWLDWKSGTRSVKLYCRHIPKYQKLNDAERALAVRRLMSAIRKREKREVR